MKLGSTHFLRLAIVVFGLGVAGLCTLLGYSIYSGWAEIFPDYAYLTFPLLAGLGVSAIAFYYALYQGMTLLYYIDKERAFSELSVTALSRIKYCGLITGTLYLLSLPIFYMVAQYDDAPGLIIIGMLFTGAPLVIAVFAAVMQKLVQSAIDIKRENELTV